MSSPALPFVECEQIHAGLAVSDLHKALDFYTNKLGLLQNFPNTSGVRRV